MFPLLLTQDILFLNCWFFIFSWLHRKRAYFLNCTLSVCFLHIMYSLLNVSIYLISIICIFLSVYTHCIYFWLVTHTQGNVLYFFLSLCKLSRIWIRYLAMILNGGIMPTVCVPISSRPCRSLVPSCSVSSCIPRLQMKGAFPSISSRMAHREGKPGFKAVLYRNTLAFFFLFLHDFKSYSDKRLFCVNTF